MINRIEECFAKLKSERRAGLVTFTMMGDPDIETSFEILKGLPDAGADIIEIGTPFTDPMADGPVIQASGQRALKAGITLRKTLDLVRRFRLINSQTPLVLMGYFNPIYIYGVEQFLIDAKSVGLDGVIVVDLPSEEDEELCIPALSKNLAFIRLIAPTTDSDRLPVVLNNSAGFVYYIAIAGITGAGAAESKSVAQSLDRIRTYTDLPICVGFGVKTPDQCAAIAKFADGVVVGSAIVGVIDKFVSSDNTSPEQCISAVHKFVHSLSRSIHAARK